MDKIYVNQMEFYGYHGVFPEENKLGQHFKVDLILELNLQKAGMSDDVSDSIDYGHVYQLTKEIVEGRAKKLVEAVAEEIANCMLSTFDRLIGCTVKVYKPNPPIPGHYHSVAIEIYREKKR